MTGRMRSNGEGRPVAALDIDGTLGDYHSHFLSFAEQWIGRPMPKPSEVNPGIRLHKFMGVPLRTYRECKLAYRQGGLKRWMPVYAGAAELVAELRRAGADIWICTTRPYLRLDNIDPDTREWLRRAGIRPDAVIYGDDKYRELQRQAGSRVALVLEDLPELYHEAVRRFPDAEVWVRMQPYNHGLETELQVCDFLPFERKLMVGAVNSWKERGGEHNRSRRG